MRRYLSVASIIATVAALTFLNTAPASAKIEPKPEKFEDLFERLALGPENTPGQAAFFGTGITECPHAGEPADKNPKPLDQLPPDKVAQLSNGGDDIKVNQDYMCMPQNETSIAVNPLNAKNVVAGQNDYHLGWGTSGFDASTDNGNHWEHRIRSFPTAGTPLLSPVLLSDDHLDSGGDPAIAFDRDGVVYYADIHFEREKDDNGIFVARSTNGGFTWSRPCLARARNPSSCGSIGDPRTPGDGTVSFQEDPDGTDPAPALAFEDKEYITTGPRPAGVTPQCFTSQHQPMACPADRPIGVDRIYVTWTRFTLSTAPAEIMLSYSDDQARSWSPATAISGSANFCLAFQCNLNQFSNPTVNPTTGVLWVGFENFNTLDENQYLVVRSVDGGQTFTGPFFVSFIFDVNYPDAGGDRPDCTDRGQASGVNVLDNSCFRVPTAANIVADKRGGAFADDLYVTFEDNRNGTRESTNADIWFFKSTDGGQTWIGPTRVNNDGSTSPLDRDCSPGDPDCAGPFGNDQYFPWADISKKGDINIGFNDRRLDTTSTLSEWPESRTRETGNYLSWYFTAVCPVTTTATVGPADVGKTFSQLPAAARQCVAPSAGVITPSTSPLVSPGSSDTFGGPGFLAGFKNATLSDVPSNHDYSFRNGIFVGDYTNVAIGPDGTAYAIWADSRNGRGSGTGGANVNQQPGRNPACEQSDIFMDSYSSNSPGTVKTAPSVDVINAFSVTPCPPGELSP